MSVNEFVQQTLQEKKEEVDKIRKLEQILEQIGGRRPSLRIYSISVTSNT